MKNEKFKNNKDLKICLIMQSNHLIEYSNILSRLLYLEQYKKNPIKNLAKLIDKNLLDDEILKLTNETKFYLENYNKQREEMTEKFNFTDTESLLTSEKLNFPEGISCPCCIPKRY